MRTLLGTLLILVVLSTTCLGQSPWQKCVARSKSKRVYYHKLVCPRGTHYTILRCVGGLTAADGKILAQADVVIPVNYFAYAKGTMMAIGGLAVNGHCYSKPLGRTVVAVTPTHLTLYHEGMVPDSVGSYMEADPTLQKATFFKDREVLIVSKRGHLTVLRIPKADTTLCQAVLRHERVTHNYGYGDGGSTLQTGAKTAAYLCIRLPKKSHTTHR